ncbi:MAG: hypothetical protein HRF49_10470 [bacterium]|jgi:ribosomal protein L25 (general stress protein Ctc)
METVVLSAEPRAAAGSSAAGRLRRAGFLPANIYGAGIEGSIPVQLSKREAESQITRAAKEYSSAGKNPKDVVYTIKVGKDEYRAKLGEVQRDVISREFIHLDFVVSGEEE